MLYGFFRFFGSERFAGGEVGQTVTIYDGLVTENDLGVIVMQCPLTKKNVNPMKIQDWQLIYSEFKRAHDLLENPTSRTLETILHRAECSPLRAAAKVRRENKMRRAQEKIAAARRDGPQDGPRPEDARDGNDADARGAVAGIKSAAGSTPSQNHIGNQDANIATPATSNPSAATVQQQENSSSKPRKVETPTRNLSGGDGGAQARTVNVPPPPPPMGGHPFQPGPGGRGQVIGPDRFNQTSEKGASSGGQQYAFA